MSAFTVALLTIAGFARAPARFAASTEACGTRTPPRAASLPHNLLHSASSYIVLPVWQVATTRSVHAGLYQDVGEDTVAACEVVGTAEGVGGDAGSCHHSTVGLEGRRANGATALQASRPLQLEKNRPAPSPAAACTAAQLLPARLAHTSADVAIGACAESGALAGRATSQKQRVLGLTQAQESLAARREERLSELRERRHL